MRKSIAIVNYNVTITLFIRIIIFNLRWIQAFIAALIITHRVKKYFLPISGILSFYIDPQTFLISIWQMKTISFARPELCLIDLKRRQKRLLPSLCYLEWHRLTQTQILLFSLSLLLAVCLLYTHILFSSLSHPHTSITHTYTSIQSRTCTISLPFLQAVEMLLWL